MHRIKYHNFTKFSGVEILWKGAVSAFASSDFSFPQHFHAKKLGDYGGR